MFCVIVCFPCVLVVVITEESAESGSCYTVAPRGKQMGCLNQTNRTFVHHAIPLMRSRTGRQVTIIHGPTAVCPILTHLPLFCAPFGHCGSIKVPFWGALV
uniref:Putative secreted protein n=1 Tax=Anopheles darlingi TaxID=43151 RepID=A0A2M4DCI2_ANODA